MRGFRDKQDAAVHAELGVARAVAAGRCTVGDVVMCVRGFGGCSGEPAPVRRLLLVERRPTVGP